MSETNKFDQLVVDLSGGELTLTMVQIAIRAYFRQREDIPEGIKDLLCGTGDSGGLIYKQFSLISLTAGSLELAYRRGADREPTHD